VCAPSLRLRRCCCGLLLLLLLLSRRPHHRPSPSRHAPVVPRTLSAPSGFTPRWVGSACCCSAVFGTASCRWSCMCVEASDICQPPVTFALPLPAADAVITPQHHVHKAVTNTSLNVAHVQRCAALNTRRAQPARQCTFPGEPGERKTRESIALSSTLGMMCGGTQHARRVV
jgi:hypothetical protein